METTILLLIVLAGAVTFQFYNGRRLNLLLMRHYLKEIEDVVKPTDKEYVWLGGYVGYRAKYKVPCNNVSGVETTLTLLPRQSLLYFPISLLTSRHDKLYFVFKLKEAKGEAHLIQKGYFRIKPKIENEMLAKDCVEIGDVAFEVLFDDYKLVDKLVELVKALPNPKNIKHISISSNVFYVFMKPEPADLRDYLNVFYKFACKGF